MGIQGLLPLLKSIQKPTHLRNFAGQTLGIDAYGWLHRGTVACAIDLAQQKPTRKHIEFALNRVRMLIHFGVKPYLVFDGDYLPSKAHTEKDRASRRKESKRVGLELLRMGRLPQAQLELQKSVDVTPLMARELIEELKRMDVPYTVAPYEADSQLAYLEKKGVIHGILSEDSDLLVFGTECLLTKLDQYGSCIMINRADFTACQEISLVGWTDKEFRIMAMLSGCDYLSGIDKMGLKTAYRLVRKHKTVERVIRTVQFDGKMKVPPGYLDAFTKAERTFLHQWVFCPEAKCLLNLNPVPEGVDVASMPYLGQPDGPEIAAGVASGDLDPNTKEPLIVAPRPQQYGSHSRTMQTPDEKQGKPISEFFKPRRTPLAELDPNSFTPSPSQQRLMESQPNTSWSASQVPAPRLSRMESLSANDAPSSAPQPARRALSQISSAGPPKKQRLCSDGLLAASMGGDVGLNSKSRFFSGSMPQGSPSIRKSSANKKRDDFNLWSDDSAAEAVAALTATPETEVPKGATSSPRKRKKLSVFSDSAEPQPEESGPSASTNTSQDSVATVESVSSVEQSGVETPATSFEEDVTSQEKSIFSKGIDRDLSDLKSRFSFKPSLTRQSIGRTISAPLARTRPLPQVAQSDKTLDLAVEPAEKSGCDTTSPDKDDEIVPNSSPPARGASLDLSDEIDDDEWQEMEKQPVFPRAQASAKGSEDFIVPESPTSGDDEVKEKPKLDLGRFAFAG